MVKLFSTTMCCLCALCALCGFTDSEPPTTGAFVARFTERHPLSTVDDQLDRFQWQGERPQPEYDLTEESFAVYVPEDYDPAEPYGLLVWASASNRGTIRWHAVLDEHKLICVAPNNIGNPRDIWARTGLCLDAVHNVRQRYNIDPDRIYVAGFSKGGRTASRLGIIYADVFTGAMPIDGVDWWQSLPVPGQRGMYYKGRFKRPADPQLLRKTRTQNRYVLLTGEHDGNRDQTKTFFHRGYKRAGFRHAHYLEVPGKGHAPPDDEWFEKGIELLDKPLQR